MFWLQCKILGETLNVTVQTLVAGAFVSYMPTTIFWLRQVHSVQCFVYVVIANMVPMTT